MREGINKVVQITLYTICLILIAIVCAAPIFAAMVDGCRWLIIYIAWWFPTIVATAIIIFTFEIIMDIAESVIVGGNKKQ